MPKLLRAARNFHVWSLFAAAKDAPLSNHVESTAVRCLAVLRFVMPLMRLVLMSAGCLVGRSFRVAIRCIVAQRLAIAVSVRRAWMHHLTIGRALVVVLALPHPFDVVRRCQSAPLTAMLECGRADIQTCLLIVATQHPSRARPVSCLWRHLALAERKPVPMSAAI